MPTPTTGLLVLDAQKAYTMEGTDLHCRDMTNFCCESTARDAHDKDFLVTFLSDATGCPDLLELSQEEIREVVGILLGAGLATVLDTDRYLEQDASAR